MISVSGKKWEQKKINQNLVDKLKQDFNFSDILSRLIISRKFDVDEIITINTDYHNTYENLNLLLTFRLYQYYLHKAMILKHY